MKSNPECKKKRFKTEVWFIYWRILTLLQREIEMNVLIETNDKLKKKIEELKNLIPENEKKENLSFIDEEIDKFIKK